MKSYRELVDKAVKLEALLEKIEDEYDSTLFNKVWDEEQQQERIRHDQLKRELGL